MDNKEEYHIALLRQALGALEYHTRKTRPIQRTDDTIEAIRSWLRSTAAGIYPSVLVGLDDPEVHK